MSVTNKKTDTLRRLFLGPLYGECKDNPMGVSRDQLQKRLDKLIDDGCVLDCSVDEMVKTCQLKSHYPLCAKDRKCIEETWPKQTGIDKLSYQQYNTSKMFEDEPDTDDEEEGEVCNICGLDGDDEKGQPVKEMSCGHHSHISCLQNYYSMPTNRIVLKPQEKDLITNRPIPGTGDIDPETGTVVTGYKSIDNARCIECRKIFSFKEVPMERRTEEQRSQDSLIKNEFNASQMGFHVPTAEERENEELRRDNEERRRMEDLLRRQREREELIRESMRARGIQEPQRRVENLSEEFKNIGRQINAIYDSRLVLREQEKEQIRQLVSRLEAIASTPDERRKVEQMRANLRYL